MGRVIPLATSLALIGALFAACVEDPANNSTDLTIAVETGASDFAANYDGVLSDDFIVNARFSSHKEKSNLVGRGANTPPGLHRPQRPAG